MTVQQALVQATQCIKTSSTPALDAELLLAYILRKPREHLFTHPEKQLTTAQAIRFSRLVTRRQKREPIAYILGHKEFFGLEFTVNKQVLVPRPETELLVEEVIRLLSGKTHPKIIDIGVGSGAIAVALKHSLPKAKVYGTDYSRKALEVARKNARKQKTAITFKYGSLLSPFPKVQFDCIVSNPPYLTSQELKNPDLHFEPRAALFGGRGGIEVYKKLLSEVPAHLIPGGSMFLEIGSTQSKSLISLVKKVLPNAWIQIKKDLAQRDRILIVTLKTSPVKA